MNKLVAPHLFIPLEFPLRAEKTTPHRMHQSPSQTEQKIIAYWARRSQGLSEAEWQDFYRLVVPILLATQLPAEYADRAARRDLVDIFFAEKIFLNASVTRAGPLENVHALHLYLKRFALDIQRRGVTLTTEEEETEAVVEAAHDVGNSPEAYGRILAEAGIDLEQASRSAGQFLGELDPGEAAYLRHHSCAEHEDKEAISSIAERLALGSSYHYKAKTLGITRAKGETYADYEKTKIGRWLLAQGAKFSTEWQEELAILLILLCLKVHGKTEESA